MSDAGQTAAFGSEGAPRQTVVRAGRRRAKLTPAPGSDPNGIDSAPDDDELILDRRWLLQGPGLLTRLARAQLAGPPSYLQGAVVSGVPEYTTLPQGAVSVVDQGGGPTVSETRAEARTKAEAKARENPVIAAIFSAVPGARITAIRDETPPPPADDAAPDLHGTDTGAVAAVEEWDPFEDED